MHDSLDQYIRIIDDRPKSLAEVLGAPVAVEQKEPEGIKSFANTADLAPEWLNAKETAGFKAAGVPLFAPKGKPNASQWLFHFTTIKGIAHIKASGLQPRGPKLERPGQRPTGVYAADSLLILATVDRDLPYSTRWILLRFKAGARAWKRDPEYKIDRGAWYTQSSVDSTEIEALQQNYTWASLVYGMQQPETQPALMQGKRDGGDNYTAIAQHAAEKGPNAAGRPAYDSSPDGMAFSVGLWARENGVTVQEVKASRGYTYILNRRYKISMAGDKAKLVEDMGSRVPRLFQRGKIYAMKQTRLSNSYLDFLVAGATQAIGATVGATIASKALGGGAAAVVSPEAAIRVVDDSPRVRVVDDRLKCKEGETFVDGKCQPGASGDVSLTGAESPQSVLGDQATIDTGTMLEEMVVILNDPAKMGIIDGDTLRVVREAG